MFGGVAFMVDDRMLVAVMRDGALLARVDPARSDELSTRPGAGPMEMGTRTMGPSWLRVEPDAIADPAELDAWIAEARAFADQS
ncbi:MAG: TfoX/Sxy family protein [Actinobacteria bacterium]|nr:TfoX/Sxy family protein [Actinomycetota bacterium]